MIVVAGESLVDLVPDVDGRLRALPGGSPFNVAVGLGRLGVDAVLLGAISEDAFGTLLAEHLDEAGVRVRPTDRTSRPTTLAMVHLDDAGHASYGFYLDRTSATGFDGEDVARAGEEEPALAAAPLHVSLGAVRLASEGTGVTLAGLIADAPSRPFVSLDPNVRPAVIADMAAERAAIERAVGATDLVKVSDEDLDALMPGRDPLAVAGQWARSGPALVVVTRGGEGATAVRTDGGTLTVASLPVPVVDTVGAGDAFTSGLIAALDERALLDRDALRGADVTTLREVLAFASRVAAITCTRRGAEPPTLAELAAA